MFRSFFVFTIFAFTNATYGQICQNARQCISQYLDHLNIPTPPFPGYSAIIMEKQRFLALGQEGLNDLCSWQAQFMSCMKQDLQCLNSYQALAQKLGKTDSEAEQYEIYFAENEYECGDGRNELLDNLQCFKNQSLQIITKCRSKYSEPIIDSSKRCEFAVTLTECLRDEFRGACGKSGGEFMCNEEKVALEKSSYADCSSKINAVDCSKGAHRVIGTITSILVTTAAYLY